MKRITVKDIARELNISLGTINKVFHDKPGVGDDTRKKVMETAERLGYKVNRVAQSLARNPVQIGVIMPEVWSEYYGYFRKGINQELENLSDYNVLGKYYAIPGLHSEKETNDALDKCIKDGMNAVILCPVFFQHKLENIDSLNEKGIILVGLGYEITGSDQCSVMVDTVTSGRLAAEFMSLIIDPSKPVAVFIGNKNFLEHKNKMDGFLDEAKRRNMQVAGVYETQDEPEIAYLITGKVLRDVPRLGGIYSATGNSVTVCKYIQEQGIKDCKLIGTDINQDLIKYVKSGILQGVIYQNPIQQGRAAVKAIYDRIINRKAGQEQILIPPQLVLSSNIDAYLQDI